MKTRTTPSNRRNLGLLIGGITVITALVIAGLTLGPNASSKQPAVKQFKQQLAQLHETYMAEPAKTQQLSQLPTGSQKAFLNHAAEYYGVTSDSGNGTPPAPLEVVGACMRERNIELSQTYAKLPIAEVEANERDIDEVRIMIATDCYHRYSSDGEAPARLTEDIHHH